MARIPINDLCKYVIKQVENVFPDNVPIKAVVSGSLEKAVERLEYYFSKIVNKYYNENGLVVFDCQHTDQYAAFLYFLSNTIWENSGDRAAASKIYSLNKALHAIDVFYEVQLPNIFLFTHPVGTVLGRAVYSDYLIIGQGVTVGGNKNLIYPEIGEGVYLYSHSAIIGKSKIGNNNFISIGTIVREENTPEDVIVYNHSGEIIFKPTASSVRCRYFRSCPSTNEKIEPVRGRR